jgi:hypothetical protein
MTSITPVTKAQWKSILISVVMTFVATFAYELTEVDNLTKVAVEGAVVAGIMAAFKIVQKLLTPA